VRTALLLICSNVFMTFAWYGHLTRDRFKAAPLWIVVLGSWLIALFEYCFQVPANRIGAETGFTAAQLKIMHHARRVRGVLARVLPRGADHLEHLGRLRPRAAGCLFRLPQVVSAPHVA
jgi:hypothetical protein